MQLLHLARARRRLKIATQPLKKLRFGVLAERLHLDAAAASAHGFVDPARPLAVGLVDARVRLFAGVERLEIGEGLVAGVFKEDRMGAIAHHDPVALAEFELKH